MATPSIHIGATPLVGKTRAAFRPRREAVQTGLMAKLNGLLASISSIKPAEKASFFRLLATMIDAGISIVKSLDILVEQMENPVLKKVISGLVEHIEGGGSLSEAIARYPKHFTVAEVGMVEAGEASGQLKEVLGQIAKTTEKSAAFIRKIKSAMIYPVVIILVMIGAGFGVMTFVMPKIKDLFSGLGGELPPLTTALIGVSDFLLASTLGIPNVLWVLLLCGALGSAVFWAKKRTALGARLWTHAVMVMPVFGKLSKKASIARFCRSLNTLISSGIPILKTLYITANSIGNSVYEERILKIADDVKHGISMAENMKGDKKYFPSMVVGMIGVAEQTAQLDKISDRLAAYYEEEVDDLVKGLSALIEPIIIVVLGISVAGLVFAVMQPILSVSDLVT